MPEDTRRELRPRAWMAALLVGFMLYTCAGCGGTDPLPPARDPGLLIKLRWIKSYPSQSRSDVDVGLYWALSFLGAKLPADAAVLSWDGALVTLDLNAAAVAQATTPARRKLLQVLKSSDEYRMMGGIDIGRFVFLSLCSSYQYYALTGVSPSYAEFRAAHTFSSRQVAIVESAVAHGNRLIEVAKAGDFNAVAFGAYRKTLESKVDFKGLQDHSRAEALYLSFAEPTASRLASKWNIPRERVEQVLAGRNLRTHRHSEALDDDILGDELYDRNDVDSLAPYAAIRGPSDMREASSYEPRLLQ